MVKHLKISISGRVQGVGFRESAKKIADRLGIAGTVENLPDGTVLIHAEGEGKALHELLAWCQKGPAAASVHTCDYHFGKPSYYQQFDIIL